MKSRAVYSYLSLISFLLSVAVAGAQNPISSHVKQVGKTSSKKAGFWLTNADKTALFQKQKKVLQFSATENLNATIEVNENESFQHMDGFGFCLTGGSAMLLSKMNVGSRAALLKELFATDGKNIGVSYLRISIGSSDLDDHVFSYDDLPVGETDPDLKKFSIREDMKYLVPVLKEILKITPKIKLLASPWSPPAWMKTNDSSKGGSLKPEFYDSYAKYFVKYIKQMKSQAIRIDAITVQNEPLHPGNNPSLLMLAADQAIFVKDHLGPAFKSANIDTKIIIYDHNADRPDYPISVLNDPDAKKYIDGSAFHLYGGSIEALSKVHDAHPDKNIYFTEQWVGAPANFPVELNWHVKNLIIGATRNWARTVLEWNLASDPNQNPHTPGGCDRCLGAVTIDGNKVTRNPAYYIIAHASKFVRPGSVRVASNVVDNLPNVAFKTPQGKRVLIVLNESKTLQTFNVSYNHKMLTSSLNAGAAGTYVW